MRLWNYGKTDVNEKKKLFLLPPSGQNAQIKHKKFLPFQNILNI